MFNSFVKLVVAVTIVVTGLLVTASSAADVPEAVGQGGPFTPEQVEFFEKRVRPILVEHCYECHSSEAEEVQAGLLLDRRESVVKGGDSGPALVPGDPINSRILQAVRYEKYEMPPAGKLSAKKIADLENWVRMRAPWPVEEPVSLERPEAPIDIDAGRQFWSFQPLVETVLPEVGETDWPRTRIDHFVLSMLETEGLSHAPEADKQTLVRRLYFDLIGLPPTYEEVEAFVADDSATAYESLVERLMAAPHYGERWARHWLDLARYAEDNPDGALAARHAHRYRDWVVGTFNDGLPYDQFVRRQLAADAIEGLPKREYAALGFLGLSPSYFKGEKLAPEVMAAVLTDEWEERIDVVSRTFLGLTVACARCHDHKYDPITTADYYGLAGIMASTQLVEQPIVEMFDEDAAYIAELTDELRYHEKRYEQRFKQREGLKKDRVPDVYRYDKEILESASEIQRITSLLPPGYDRVPRANAVRDAASSIDDQFYVIRELISPEARFWTKVHYEAGEVRDVPIHIRGSVRNLGPVVPRRFIEVLSADNAKPFRIGSGRLELANAILSDAAGLTGRVIVNRVWGWHFGRPLVRTPSNFGQLGERPSHPRLLDDLAFRFVSEGWSLRDLHRDIVCSATYRQASHFDAFNYAADPDNRFLSRMNRHRIEIETWRDAALKVAGRLDMRLGGPSADLSDTEMRRRTLYGQVSRRELAPLLQLFDFPQATRHSAARNTTTTPLQQLYYLNSRFVRAQCEMIVRNLRDDASGDDQRIRELFHRILARDPDVEELAMARRLVTADIDLERHDQWSMLAQVLLVSNEFLFVD